jgi:hypothetical protein
MSIRSLPTLSGAAVLLTASLTTHAQAQCWSIASLDVPAGVDGRGRWVNTCTLWDPDGAGPLSQRLVVAGPFSSIAGVSATNVAQWDGTRWSRLGSTAPDNIFDLLPLPDGTLLAAGAFSVPSRGVARFDGTAWVPVGLGVSSRVNDLLPLPDGSVLLAGSFSAVEGNPAGRLARFDPTTGSISPFPSPDGGANSQVYAAALAPDGSLLIAGTFTSVGGIPASRVARWDGTSWSALGSGISSGEVYDITVDPTGIVYVGGRFTVAGGVTALNIAAWDGSSWSAFNAPGIPGVNDSVFSLLADPAGGILVAGDFTEAGDQPIARLARWNNGWSDPGADLDDNPYTLVDLEGTLAVTGAFTRAGGYPANGLAFRDEQGQWLPTTTTPYTGIIEALATLPDGRVVAAAPYFARESFGTTQLLVRDNGVWQALSTPYTGIVRALLPMPDGSVIAAGSLTAVSGTPVNNIARWTPGPDLGSWQPLASGTSGEVLALAHYNNDIIAAGNFAAAGGSPAANIARFEDNSWSPLTSGTDQPVTALLSATDGTLIVAGDFNTAGDIPTRGGAMWNGTTWAPMPFRFREYRVKALVESPTLGLFAARNNSSEPLSRWTGSSWEPAALSVRGFDFFSIQGNTLTVLQSGDLVFGGHFTSIDGIPAQSLARWNGRGWASLNPAFFPFIFTNTVNHLAVTPSGDLAVAGNAQGQAFYTIAPTDEPNPPTITLQPDDILTCSQTLVTLTMAAEYDGTLTYRWYDALGQSQQSPLGTGPTLTIETSVGPRTVIGVAAGDPCDGSARTRTITLFGVLVDQTFDGFIDFFDYSGFLLYFERGFTQADVNRDGFLDFFDYDLFLQFFESGC